MTSQNSPLKVKVIFTINLVLKILDHTVIERTNFISFINLSSKERNTKWRHKYLLNKY